MTNINDFNKKGFGNGFLSNVNRFGFHQKNNGLPAPGSYYEEVNKSQQPASQINNSLKSEPSIFPEIKIVIEDFDETEKNNANDNIKTYGNNNDELNENNVVFNLYDEWKT